MTSTSGYSTIDHEFRSCIPFLALMTGIFFTNFLSRIILAPLMPSLERDLDFSHLESGSLFLCVSAGYFISLLSAGFISSRLTHKQTIFLSCIALGIANLWISFCGNLNTLRVGMLMIGLATGMYLPSAITTLTAMVQTRHWGKALSIHELAPNLALIAAPLIAEAFLAWISWRSAMIVTGLISLCLAAMIYGSGEKGTFKSQKPSLLSLRELISIPSFWIIIVLYSLAISSVLGIYTMLPLYLVSDLNIDQNTANTWIAFSRVFTLPMVFIAGWAIDRFGSKLTIGICLLLTGIFTVLIGAVSGRWIFVFVFLQPLSAVCFFPASMTALSHIFSEKMRNMAVSLTVPVAYLAGAGVIPTGMGAMGDLGHFSVGFIILGGLIMAGAMLTTCLKTS